MDFNGIDLFGLKGALREQLAQPMDSREALLGGCMRFDAEPARQLPAGHEQLGRSQLTTNGTQPVGAQQFRVAIYTVGCGQRGHTAAANSLAKQQPAARPGALETPGLPRCVRYGQGKRLAHACRRETQQAARRCRGAEGRNEQAGPLATRQQPCTTCGKSQLKRKFMADVKRIEKLRGRGVVPRKGHCHWNRERAHGDATGPVDIINLGQPYHGRVSRDEPQCASIGTGHETLQRSALRRGGTGEQCHQGICCVQGQMVSAIGR